MSVCRRGIPLKAVVANCEAKWFLQELQVRGRGVFLRRERQQALVLNASSPAAAALQPQCQAPTLCPVSFVCICCNAVQQAMSGDHTAMVRVSHMLLAGYGTRQDEAAAAEWMRKAW
jgi:TPR repeat protein